MDLRFLALSPADLFVILRTAVKAAASGELAETLSIGPFDDKLLVSQGVWLRGPDQDLLRAIKLLERRLNAVEPPIHYSWNAEPLAGSGAQNEAQAVAYDREVALLIESQEKFDEGGAGSGNFGHKGRRGLVGGSVARDRRFEPRYQVFSPEAIGATINFPTGSAEAQAIHREAASQFIQQHMGISESEFRRGFTLDHADYETRELKIEIHPGARPGEKGYLIVWGQIHAKQDLPESPGHTYVGDFKRTLYLDQKYAYHQTFDLSDLHQGRGIGAALSERQFEMYRKGGLQEVHLGANGSVGRYAWALQGFTFDRNHWEGDSAFANVQDSLRTTLMKRGLYNAQTKARMENLTEAWDIARFQVNGVKVGKEALLYADAWPGVMYLNPTMPSQKVFGAYLQAAKAKPPRKVGTYAEQGQVGRFWDQDSEAVHRELFENEDAVFDALAAALGELDVYVVDTVDEVLQEGGAGSGHHGHEGRKGAVGGSRAAGVLHPEDPQLHAGMLSRVGRENLQILAAHLDTLSSSDVKAIVEHLETAKRPANMPYTFKAGPDAGQPATEEDYAALRQEIGQIQPSAYDERLAISDPWTMGIYTSRLSEADALEVMDRAIARQATAQLQGDKDAAYAAGDWVSSIAYFGPDAASRKAAAHLEKDKPYDVTILGKSETKHRTFEVDFEGGRAGMIDEWTFTSGMPGSVTMQNAAAGIGPNAGKSLYVHAQGYPMARVKPNGAIAENLQKSYESTQAFYAKQKVIGKGTKYKQDAGGEIAVYRGVKHATAVHQPLESWTLDEGIARKFDGAGVMKAKIKVADILWSWESEAGRWPPEKQLRGKKEVTVFGGALSNVEVLR